MQDLVINLMVDDDGYPLIRC